MLPVQWASVHHIFSQWLMQTLYESSLNLHHSLPRGLLKATASSSRELCHYATCYLVLIDHFNHPVCLSDTRHAHTRTRTANRGRVWPAAESDRHSINLVIRQLEQIGTRITGTLAALARPAVTHSQDPAAHKVGLSLFFFPFLGFYSESGQGGWNHQFHIYRCTYVCMY